MTEWFLLTLTFFFLWQKFFDLEEEGACFLKDQKNTSLPKLNRNKYMVTDGAAYIGELPSLQQF